MNDKRPRNSKEKVNSFTCIRSREHNHVATCFQQFQCCHQISHIISIKDFGLRQQLFVVGSVRTKDNDWHLFSFGNNQLHSTLSNICNFSKDLQLYISLLYLLWRFDEYTVLQNASNFIHSSISSVGGTHSHKLYR